MQPVLTVENLTRSFGKKRAVDDISFEARPGEIMGFLGPNGAGKTTTIRIIMGILPAEQGRVNFHFPDRSATSMDKSQIGYLPEERGLYDDARVLDILVYLATLKGRSRPTARQEAREWLERLDLGEYGHQKLEKLSKGMQQKVQFIAAVLHGPPLLVLDEPFSGLDPLNQDLFKDMIRQLCAQGTTILLSAHQMNLVEEVCDTLFMIHEGRRVLYGRLHDIKEGYAESLVTIDYQGEADLSFLSRLAGVREVEDGSQRIRFRYADAESDINRLLQELTERLTISGISVNKPPLHEVFVETVRAKGGEVTW